MNYRERKAYSNLLLVQGSYCFILGLLLLSIPRLLYDLAPVPEPKFTVRLMGGILVGIGFTLIFAKRNYKQNSSIYSLGFFTSLSFFLHDSIYLFHFDGGSFLWLDLLIQLGFLLGWIWLLYWKWIESKFAGM